MEHNVFLLENPERLVIDIENAVLKASLRDLDLRRQRVGINGEVVVVGADLHAAGRPVTDRLVAAVMPELEAVDRECWDDYAIDFKFSGSTDTDVTE